ncbi:MAG: D-2-hydroxyacid dehydrogenase [Alphaproteobacteria bacterium]
MTGRIRVHAACSHGGPVHDDPSPESFDRAAERYPALARRLDLSFSVGRDGLAEGISDAAIIVGDIPHPPDFAQQAPAARWLHSTSAGVDKLAPLTWLPRHTVLTNSSGVHVEKAAEFASMALLMLHAGLPRLLEKQKHKVWDKRAGRPRIDGRTVLVLGAGDLGGAAAREAKRLGLHVLGVRRSGRPRRYVDEMGRPADLLRMLPAADFLFIAAPLTEETRGLIDRACLSALPPGAGVINVGRGPIMDHEALADLLDAGHLSGAILDVLPQEPLPAHSRLWTTPGLIILPHISVDDTRDYMDLSLDIFFANLERWLAGRPLRNRVNRRKGY